MPILDGFGVMIELRQNPQTSGIPVNFLSAQGEQNFIVRALELGAVAYLNKPYLLSRLLAPIKSHIAD